MTKESRDLVLGYDFGTSAVKAALFDDGGNVAASGSASYPLLLPAQGWAEQRPEDWWDAMCEVTPRLLQAANADPARIAGVGVTAQMCGVTPVDRSGEALTNCLIWLDTRSSAIAERLTAGWPKISGYGALPLLRWLRLTGGAPNLSGKDPTSKMVWLRENAGDVWPRVHKLLDVKDYIVHRLTGRFATSYDCAHVTWLFDTRTGRKQWSDTLLARVGIGRALLPDVLGASDVAGGLNATAAEALGLREGTKIAAGLGDVSAAALASGTPAYGAPHLGLGTSAWLGAALPKSRVNPLTGIGSLCGPGGQDYLLIAAQENAGSCIRWAMQALGFGTDDFEDFERLASEAEPSRGAPLFLPWLMGERVPVDDKTVRGGFLNLDLSHSRADMARAVYEGVALNVRWAMTDFDRLAGSAGKPLRAVGGAAASRLWCRIFADVLQRPIEPVEAPVLGGARGAAMAAAVAAGWFPDLSSASCMARAARSVSPDPVLASLYAERFGRFTAAYRKLRPLYNP